jgi:flagellar biosynthesis protein FliQ
MNSDDFLRLAQMGLETAIFVSAPVLGLGLVAGLVMSIFQAATQINDAALAFIPKIAAVVVALFFFGHFMVNRIMTFSRDIYEMIPDFVR